MTDPTQRKTQVRVALAFVTITAGTALWRMRKDKAGRRSHTACGHRGV